MLKTSAINSRVETASDLYSHVQHLRNQLHVIAHSTQRANLVSTELLIMGLLQFIWHCQFSSLGTTLILKTEEMTGRRMNRNVEVSILEVDWDRPILWKDGGKNGNKSHISHHHIQLLVQSLLALAMLDLNAWIWMLWMLPDFPCTKM